MVNEHMLSIFGILNLLGSRAVISRTTLHFLVIRVFYFFVFLKIKITMIIFLIFTYLRLLPVFAHLFFVFLSSILFLDCQIFFEFLYVFLRVSSRISDRVFEYFLSYSQVLRFSISRIYIFIRILFIISRIA